MGVAFVSVTQSGWDTHVGQFDRGQAANIYGSRMNWTARWEPGGRSAGFGRFEFDADRDDGRVRADTGSAEFAGWPRPLPACDERGDDWRRRRGRTGDREEQRDGSAIWWTLAGADNARFIPMTLRRRFTLRWGSTGPRASTIRHRDAGTTTSTERATAGSGRWKRCSGEARTFRCRYGAGGDGRGERAGAVTGVDRCDCGRVPGAGGPDAAGAGVRARLFGNLLPNATVTWSVNQPAATISSQGLVTAKGLATIRITARAGSVSGEAAIQSIPSRWK